MARRPWCCSAGILLLAIAGCDLESDDAAGKSQKVTRISGNTQVGAAPQQSPLAGASAPGQSRIAAQPAEVQPASSFPIRLSAGTALPQTGPEGTVIGFSVDYRSGGYRPAGDAHCVLVVETASGRRAEERVEIAEGGTWTLFVNGWDPEAGPFQAHVAELAGDGSRKRISAKVPLR